DIFIIIPNVQELINGCKVYSQNQQTYVVCQEPTLHSQEYTKTNKDDLDLLLLLNTNLLSNKSRKPRILRGEVLVKWKKNKSVKKDGNMYFA
ncbi:1452_t:CDS:2, partial [Scutellospora calospora]